MASVVRLSEDDLLLQHPRDATAESIQSSISGQIPVRFLPAVTKRRYARYFLDID